MILEKIRQCKNIEEVCKYIQEIFNESIDTEYMPALISEGTYTVSSGEDFYAKLVAIPNKAKINKTWLKMNLAKSDISRSEDNYDVSCYHNIIVEYPFLSNKLYAYNDSLVSIDEIFYGKQDDVKIACQFYNSSKYNKKPLCLKNINDNYYVLKDLLDDITNQKYSDALQLCVDFEYRSKELLSINKQGKFVNKFGCFDIVNSLEGGTSILGSIYLPFKNVKNKTTNDNIKVIRILDNNLIDSLDKTNYNDDTKVGIVLFSTEVLSILKKYYNFYDFTLISHTGNQDIIIDILEDRVAFFEGEFNKFPDDIVDEIQKYNIKEYPADNTIISPAMFEWQLNASRYFMDKAFPFQKLGYVISSKHIEKAKDEDLSLYPPTNLDELIDLYHKIIKVLNISDQTKNVKSFVKGLLNKGNSLFYCYQCVCMSIYKEVTTKDD